jgi:hypothetical protein
VFLVRRHVASAFVGCSCRQVESRQGKPWEQCYGRHQHFHSFNDEDRFCGTSISSEQWYGDGKRNDSFVVLSYVLLLLQFIFVRD